MCISDIIYYVHQILNQSSSFPEFGWEVAQRVPHGVPIAKLECGQPSLQQGFHRGIPPRVRVVWCERQSMRGHLESELAKPMRWYSISKGILVLTLSQISSITHSNKTGICRTLGIYVTQDKRDTTDAACLAI